MRHFRFMLSCTALLLVIATVVPASAQLYGATGSNGVAGHLFILDPTTGLPLLDVGALMTVTGAPVGMTGLAFDPGSGILFGSTANRSPNLSVHLVTIDPLTALVTDVGSFGAGVSTLSDISFDPTSGTLYGWQAASGHHLVTVNTSTGAITTIGPGTGDFGGRGIASEASGTIFITPDGITAPPGNLDTVDNATGIITGVGPLSGSPLGFGMNALAFDGLGVLFGDNDGGTQSSARHLVTIDTATGAVTDIGRTVENLDAIAFHPNAVPEPGTLALLMGSGVVGSLVVRRRRSRS
jgi:hypothetical protein